MKFEILDFNRDRKTVIHIKSDDVKEDKIDKDLLSNKNVYLFVSNAIKTIENHCNTNGFKLYDIAVSGGNGVTAYLLKD